MSAAKVTPIRPATTSVPGDFLSPEQVCELVPGLTVANLKDLRTSGRGPAFFKPTGERGKVTIYARADVVDWVKRSRTSTKDQT